MIPLDADTLSQACLLLDGAVFDAPRFVYQNDDQPEIEYLFLGTAHQAAMEASPCLVRPSDTARLWQLQPEWQDKAVVLVSEHSLPVIAEHLRSLLSVRLPDGGYAYLRYYSPKQLRRLMCAFNDRERHYFSGPIREWLTFQPDEGYWARFPVEASQSTRTASDEGWFTLTEQHVKALSDDARSEFVEKLGRFLSISDRSQLNHLIEEANRLGFRTEKDVSRYAELAMVYGDRIARPESQAILSNPGLRTESRLNALDKHLAYGVAR
nr:DUF4123 domain-containing protein [uncultured Marinobacter sp.]